MTIEKDEMDSVTCQLAQLTVQEAAPRLVRDAMLATPKTLPGNATVGQVRELFADHKVVDAVLVDGTAFVGVLGRGDLPVLMPDAAPARGCARRNVPTITPGRPMREAMDLLDARRAARLVVLRDDGVTLAGLLCLDRQRAGFCQG